MRNIALALLFSIAAAGCSQDGQGPMHPASALDRILVIGKDTRTAWKQFMHNGGLQAHDQWKDYTVQNVSLGFDSKNQLSEISMVLSPGIHNRAPTFAHISEDLADICGQDWHKGTPSVAKHGDIICLFSPSKKGEYDRLEISKMEGMGASGMGMGMMGTPKM